MPAKGLNTHNDVIWRTKTARKWRKSKFRVYCLKKKTLDNFINDVVGDRHKSFHIAFGATTGKGEHYSSPYSLIGKLMRERVGGEENFSSVDEWNTSKVCHRCFRPLTRVSVPENWNKKRKGRGRGEKYVRGLLRCCSTESNDDNNLLSFNNTGESTSSTPPPSCPIAGSFVDRDSNAATNIALKLLVNTPNLKRGIRVYPPQSIFQLRKNHHYYHRTVRSDNGDGSTSRFKGRI